MPASAGMTICGLIRVSLAMNYTQVRLKRLKEGCLAGVRFGELSAEVLNRKFKKVYRSRLEVVLFRSGPAPG
jgi:hypothetical protein